MSGHVDWSAWRMCPVCRAGTGSACYVRSGRVITDGDGLSVPDGVNVYLDRPHVSRRARTGRDVVHPREGDIAVHVNGRWDGRSVARVTGREIWILIGSRACGPLPIENYTYRRPAGAR